MHFLLLFFLGGGGEMGRGRGLFALLRLQRERQNEKYPDTFLRTEEMKYQKSDFPIWFA